MEYIQRHHCTPKFVDRDALGIPERNLDYDTRMLVLDLGALGLYEGAIWERKADANNEDAMEAFCIDITKLSYENLEQEQVGQFTNYYLTRDDFQGEQANLKVRPTMLIALNGPAGKPELGHAASLTAIQEGVKLE